MRLRPLDCAIAATLLAFAISGPAAAMGPDRELDSRRRIPPNMISRTDGTSISKAATFNAFVMTLMDFRSDLRNARAISAVVVPESRMMVSPSRIIEMAAWAIRTFSA